MKVYIAGASAELDLIEFYRDRVVEVGHTISLDWAHEVRAHDGEGNPRDMPHYERNRIARTDLVEGVEQAQVLWLLVPEKPSIGCWVELGYALGIECSVGRLTILISGDTSKSIFTAMADHLFPLHADALAWLKAKR